MRRLYQALLTLYPPHVRTIYSAEMIRSFEAALSERHGVLSRIRFVVVSTCVILMDATVERLWTFGSHPSFTGRRPSDLGVVRPPNMSKAEWFHAGSSPPSAPAT